MKRKKRKISGVDPEYLRKMRASLLRRHRQVIYLNDNEMAAIDMYCSRFNVRKKSVMYREAVMEKVLSDLQANPPTLF